MRYIIYGAGAVGGTIGARLALKGHNVILICRGEHLKAIQSNGLRYKTPKENHRIHIPAVEHPNQIEFTTQDIVLFTMKTQHSFIAMQTLRDHAGDSVPVVCAQNGVSNEIFATRFFRQVYGMLVMMPASHSVAGEVQSESDAMTGILDAGSITGGRGDPLLTKLTSDLEDAGFSAVPKANILAWKYAKMLRNLRNGVQVIADDIASYEDIYSRIQNEALACYRKAGIKYIARDEYFERRAKLINVAPVDGKTREGSSTLQSVLRGTGTIETDYLNGEITRLGRVYKVPTPCNRLVQLLANDVALGKLALKSVSIENFESRLLALK